MGHRAWRAARKLCIGKDVEGSLVNPLLHHVNVLTVFKIEQQQIIQASVLLNVLWA
jgi:hypothetical protein